MGLPRVQLTRGSPLLSPRGPSGITCRFSPPAAFGRLSGLRLFDLSHGVGSRVCLTTRFIFYTTAGDGQT